MNLLTNICLKLSLMIRHIVFVLIEATNGLFKTYKI